MTPNQTPLTILLDEGAPIQAAEPFHRRGHKVLKHNDVLPSGATDAQVVAMAMSEEAILVAVDRDMKAFVRRFGAPNDNEKYESLNLLFLGCAIRTCKARVAQALDLIELEWDFRCGKPTRCMWVTIEDHRITTYR